MKNQFCAIICEFNPFHNGHAHLLRQARERSGCEHLLCVMSGAFTQRGEAAVLSKFIRARHAVLGGADLVISLPPAYSVAPAEIFAKGAVQLITAIPQVDCVAFGCECGSIEALTQAAKTLLSEPPDFRHALEQSLANGESYIRSMQVALTACGGNGALLESPNNVLAIAYIKALLSANFKGKILAIPRVGANHKDSELTGNICSASAIRSHLQEDLSAFAPPFVNEDLPLAQSLQQKLQQAERLCLLRDDGRQIAGVYGCSEGLENALKDKRNLPFDEITKAVVSKRYSLARIERILCANLLKLQQADTERYLSGKLYLRPLAVNGKKQDALFKVLANAKFPLLIRGRDESLLTQEGKDCLKSEIFADEIYDYLANTHTSYFSVVKVEF